MKETASNLLRREVYDWIIDSIKKRIFLAKSESGLAVFSYRDVQTMDCNAYPTFTSFLRVRMLKGLSHPGKTLRGRRKD